VWQKSETSTVDVRSSARAKVRTSKVRRPGKTHEADRVTRSDQITEKTPIPPPDWEALIEVIAKDMIEERSPARILQVRAKLYDLLTHCIPATTILKVCEPNDSGKTEKLLTRKPQTLTFKLMPKIDDVLKADVVKWSAFYEHRIRNGSVSIASSRYASGRY